MELVELVELVDECDVAAAGEEDEWSSFLSQLLLGLEAPAALQAARGRG